jgi:hypothetical protein
MDLKMDRMNKLKIKGLFAFLPFLFMGAAMGVKQNDVLITSDSDNLYSLEAEISPIGVKDQLVGSVDFDWVNYDFNWVKYENLYDDETKISQLEKIDWQTEIGLKPYIFENLESTHFFDINNDGFNDLVYYGESGAEGLMTCIFINEQNKSFRLVFNYSSYSLCSISWVSDAVEIVVFSEPVAECSDEYFRKFILKEGDGRFVADFSSTILLNSKTSFPVEFNQSEKSFYSKVEDCTIRYSPEINNKDLGYNDLIGNVIGEIPKNIKLNVLYEGKFSDGKIWCFVEVSDDTKNTFFNECHFLYSSFEKMTVYGWVLKDDLVEKGK